MGETIQTLITWSLLVDAIQRCKESQVSLTGQVPLRDSLRQTGADPLLSGDRRAAAIGISTLIAYTERDGKRIALHRRGPLSISTRRGMFHAFPAGFFQAPFGRVDVEYSVRHCMLWEYYEEFYDVHDPVRKNRDSRWFCSEAPVADLISLLDKGTATYTLLEVAIDFMNLRPEILTLLQVDDPDWFRRTSPQFRFSREMAEAKDLPNRESVLCTIDCTMRPEDAFSAHGLNAGTLAPCSAAALVLALQRLKDEGWTANGIGI